MKAFVQNYYRNLAQQVINQHADKLFSKLGIAPIPVILEEEAVRASNGPGYTAGACDAVETRSIMDMLNAVDRQAKCIHIYYMSLLAARLTYYIPAIFKKSIIDTLAHEIRHAWQSNSGEWRNHSEITSFFMSLIIPYEHKWEEKDANKFAHDYTKSVGK
jgi:hypothetical protein